MFLVLRAKINHKVSAINCNVKYIGVNIFFFIFIYLFTFLPSVFQVPLISLYWKCQLSFKRPTNFRIDKCS